MKVINFISACAVCVGALTYAQTMYAGHPFVYFLDEKSQSNVVFTICSMSHPIPCPAKYTNRLSNTSLFSLQEQNLLTAIPNTFRNVTSNAGPADSVLTRLDKVSFAEDNEERIVAHFSQTNSVAQEEVVFFGTREMIVKYQSTPGNGYYAELVDGCLVSCQELRGGKLSGLCVTFYNDRVVMLFHYANGKALGKFYVWRPIDVSMPGVDGLAVEAEFKEPYDFQKYALMGADLTSIDKPKSSTILFETERVPKVTK